MVFRCPLMLLVPARHEVTDHGAGAVSSVAAEVGKDQSGSGCIRIPSLFFRPWDLLLGGFQWCSSWFFSGISE